MGASISSIFSRLFWKQERKVMMVGLDAAGKTTILHQLFEGRNITNIPTIGFNVKTVQYKNISFTIWDFGGGDKLRQLWHHYFQDIVIFVVDSGDLERVEEAKDFLHWLMDNENLRDAVLLVFANKQDLPNALNSEELTEQLQLDKLKTKRWFIQSAIAKEGKGLFEGLDWITKQLEETH